MADREPDENPPDAARLAPGEIAYHEFSSAPDGLAEDEVRAFLGQVADAVSAARERELELAARLRTFEEQAASGDEGELAEGREIVREARAVRERMLADVTRRRRAFLDALDRVRAALDEAAAALARDDVPTARLETAGPVESGARSAERSAEPSAPVAPEVDVPEVDAPEVDELFARLRELAPETTGERAVPDASEGSGDSRGSERSSSSEGVIPASVERATDRNDPIRARRDDVIGPLVIDALRATKRLLQDEQNELLDACRRARGRVDAERLLPDADTAQRGWAAALRPGVDQAYLAGRAVAGRKARGKSAPDRLAADLAIALTDSLRERLRATIDAVTAEGPYESAVELHRALAPAIGARYREWKSQELETRLGDLLCAAYARGAYDGTPSGARLQWVPAELEQCPDADDNALEPTVKGQCFPTGQAYPPAHPGCRCFVVPAAIGTAAIGPAAVGDEETPV